MYRVAIVISTSNSPTFLQFFWILPLHTSSCRYHSCTARKRYQNKFSFTFILQYYHNTRSKPNGTGSPGQSVCCVLCACACVCVCSLTNLQFPDFSTFSRLVATLLCTERNRRMQCAKCRKKDPSILMSESPRADRGGGVLAPAGSRVEAGPLKDFCVH